MTVTLRKGRYVAKEKGNFTAIGPTRAHARMGILQQQYLDEKSVAKALWEKYGKH